MTGDEQKAKLPVGRAMTVLEGEETDSLLPKLPIRARNYTTKPLTLGGKEERRLSTPCGHGEGT